MLNAIGLETSRTQSEHQSCALNVARAALDSMAHLQLRPNPRQARADANRAARNRSPTYSNDSCCGLQVFRRVSPIRRAVGTAISNH